MKCHTVLLLALVGIGYVLGSRKSDRSVEERLVQLLPVERGEIADKLQHIAELKRKPQLSGEHDDQLKKKSDAIYKEEKTLENREEQLLMRELHEIIENKQIETPTRLSGGTNPSEGRVEVYRYGIWGTVCDDGWGDEEAAVVCRELGFEATGIVSSSFGEGEGRIWLENVVCTGSEDQLSECSHNGLGNYNCGHNEDVGVICRDITK